MPRSALRLFSFCLLFGLLFYCSSKSISADTTTYRSAATVTTDNISGNNSNIYTDLSNCSATDGITCNRALGLGAANLYFRDFGDFGIPSNSAITGVRIRVTGKSDISTYAGVSVLGSNPGIPFPANCQDPSDKWTMTSLVGQKIQTYNVTSTSGVDFIRCLNTANIRSNNFIFRINRAGPVAWSANIDNLEIAFDYQAAPSPTPSPSPSPSPTPTPPVPFLDLPWDYKSESKNFEQQVFNPGAWFDHEYPLQNIQCCQEKVLIFTGLEKDAFYRSHSGYDYNSQNGVSLGTPVLAAASGWATFEPESETNGAGNTIKIDHENGYQTWYEHLDSQELLISSKDEKAYVNKGEKIGKVGMTGNSTGPHIHLSVLSDSNNNGTFEDDYPWGLTDPLGWEGNNIDPWTLWEDNGRYGSESYNLFINRESKKKQEIPQEGGLISFKDVLVDIASGAFNKTLQFFIDYGPYEKTSDGKIKSVMPSVFLNAFDNSGLEINQFNEPITITYNYEPTDLVNINEESLGIYWFNESSGIWEILPSNIDLANKTVTAKTTHFTQFSLMGKLKDLSPPFTETRILGDKGSDNYYRSNVEISLIGTDSEGGIGLEYTLYTVNGSDWYEYENPLIFTDEGEYSITYQSFDKAGNKSKRESLSFNIDKTPPEAEIYYSTALKRIEVKGLDNSGIINISTLNSSGNRVSTITDAAGNKLILTYKVSVSSILSTLNVISEQQNNKPKVTFPKNSTLISLFYNLKTKNLETVAEVFSMKDKNLLGLIYNMSQNKTKIYTYDAKNRQIFKEEKTGKNLLKLYTESSTLKYRY